MNRREETIVDIARKSGKLSAHAQKRSVAKWRKKAREWEKSRKPGGDPYETTDVED